MRILNHHQQSLLNVKNQRSLVGRTSITNSLQTNKSSSTSITKLYYSKLATRLDGLDAPTVWHEFSPLAVEYKSINLGQGFPDWDPPQFVLDAMIKSINTHYNQYARSAAHLPLAETLADIYTKRFNGYTIDPLTQVATAVGCTQTLYCALQGLVNHNDEVILLEPAFDIYSSQVKMAGGKPIYVPLRPNTTENNNNIENANDAFILNMEELEGAITENTKVLILNTPHNPTGKIFSELELQQIANIISKYPQITIIADEVYEHIIFDNYIHNSMAKYLPEQTLTLSSGGKTFSCTGWKVGWAIGPPHLVKAVTSVQQWVNFSAPTPNQHAMALSLQYAEQPYYDDKLNIQYDTYYNYLASEYERKRTILINALVVANMKPIIPPGGFFIMADTSTIEFPYETEYKNIVITDAMPTSPIPRDWALSRWLTTNVGVTAIPPSAFYSKPNVPLASNLLRFAFCKGDDTIKQAHTRFQSYFGK